jgi:hypothetical protein
LKNEYRSQKKLGLLEIFLHRTGTNEEFPEKMYGKKKSRGIAAFHNS